jgi:hypothetical protein
MATTRDCVEFGCLVRSKLQRTGKFRWVCSRAQHPVFVLFTADMFPRVSYRCLALTKCLIDKMTINMNRTALGAQVCTPKPTSTDDHLRHASPFCRCLYCFADVVSVGRTRLQHCQRAGCGAVNSSKRTTPHARKLHVFTPTLTMTMGRLLLVIILSLLLLCNADDYLPNVYFSSSKKDGKNGTFTNPTDYPITFDLDSTINITWFTEIPVVKVYLYQRNHSGSLLIGSE